MLYFIICTILGFKPPVLNMIYVHTMFLIHFMDSIIAKLYMIAHYFTTLFDLLLHFYTFEI